MTQESREVEEMILRLLGDVCGDTCERSQAAVLEAFRKYGALVKLSAMDICYGAWCQGENNPLQIKRWIEADPLP